MTITPLSLLLTGCAFELIDLDHDEDNDGVRVDEGDCDDSNPSVNPNKDDIPYDGIDQDCSGADLTDVDGDGHDAEVIGGDDCDDGNPSVNPDMEETCNEIDDDCDSYIDEEVTTRSFQDSDSDGFGNYFIWQDLCYVPRGYVEDSTDCDDTDPNVYPGAVEVPYDGIDQDCDGADPTDLDGDGYIAVEAGGNDCGDTDATIHPGAEDPVSDGIDQDCVSVGCDEGEDFEYIQLAINEAPAGATIEICDGIYHQALSIDKSLKLEGIGSVILDNYDLCDPLISANGAYDLEFHNMTLQNGGPVELLELSSAVFAGIDFTGFDNYAVCPAGYSIMQVYTVAGLDVSIANSTFTDNECFASCIAMAEAALTMDNVLFRNNSVAAEWSPILLSRTDFNISNSEFSSNRGMGRGLIDVWGAETAMATGTIDNSVFSGNTAVEESSCFFLSATDLTVSNSMITGNNSTNGYAAHIQSTKRDPFGSSVLRSVNTVWSDNTIDDICIYDDSDECAGYSAPGTDFTCSSTTGDCN